jgi:endonuclease/exonuclease/phosphatase family metal-dependent hydrolase
MKPEMAIQIGSLSLANLSKRIEKRDIKKIADVLRKEKIEVLAVQGITRYPGVETRVDFVDELAKQTDMNSAFGEMMNNSGRQTGNAVFSSYPIRSRSSRSFDRIKSAKFEGALLAVIDGGVRPIHVVSAQLPPKAPVDDQASCIDQLTLLHGANKNDAVILAGNLPTSEKILRVSTFKPIAATSSHETGMWLLANQAMRVSSVRTMETDLGTIVVAQFELYRELLP